MHKQIFFVMLIAFLLVFPTAAIAENLVASSQLVVRVCLRNEICNNGIDDDCDELIDQQDSDCALPPIIIYVPGGGGGGSGGVPQSIVGIESIQTETPITNKEISAFVLVKNQTVEKKEFVVLFTVLGEDLIEYEQSRLVEIQGGSSELVSFDGWMPKTKGQKILRARVYDKEKTIVLDEKVQALEVTENILFDLEITKILGVVRPGDNIEFEIKVINKADYYSDFNLTYWIEDLNGNKLVFSEKVIAVKPGTEYIASEYLVVPSNFVLGTYLLKAQINTGDTKTTAYKSFIVSQGDIFYVKAEQWMEDSCNELLGKINSLKEAGIDTTKEANSYQNLCMGRF